MNAPPRLQEHEEWTMGDFYDAELDVELLRPTDPLFVG